VILQSSSPRDQGDKRIRWSTARRRAINRVPQRAIRLEPAVGGRPRPRADGARDREISPTIGPEPEAAGLHVRGIA